MKLRHASGLGLLATILATILVTIPACTETECATPDFTRAECRVMAENGLARLRTSSGIEVRFQAPETDPTSDPRASWSAEGLVVERDDRIVARVAHMGDFAISLHNTSASERELVVELDNIHPRATLVPDPRIVAIDDSGAKRRVQVTIPAQAAVWLRGGLGHAGACTPVFRIAVLADVQTNPTQFARIIDRLQREAADAEAAGELLVGVIMPGDLTESSTEDEFRIFADLLETASVPFALAPGNHDTYASALPHYNRNFGPGNYAFSVCDARVAVLDSGDGSIANSVIGRLPELFDPKGAQYLLAAMHHPPYAELSAAGWSREDVAMITLGEFAHQGGDLILAGHAHMLREFDEVSVAGGEIREIIAGTAGAWQGAGQPLYGYVRLSFVDGEIEACFVEVPPPGAAPHQNTTTTIPQCDEA